jgi:hypothetical protein
MCPATLQVVPDFVAEEALLAATGEDASSAQADRVRRQLAWLGTCCSSRRGSLSSLATLWGLGSNVQDLGCQDKTTAVKSKLKLDLVSWFEKVNLAFEMACPLRANHSSHRGGVTMVLMNNAA